VLNQGKTKKRDVGQSDRSRSRSRALSPCALRLLPLILLSLCGCANFWDDVTSRDFEISQLYTKPNPLVVIRDSQDGDARAKALRALREPSQFGGTRDEQEVVVKILVGSAVTGPPVCRLAAIESLGRFKDPRAVTALTDGYYSADSFPPEIATVIRCQALAAMGETRNPATIELLARVARQPATKGSGQERQQTLDERMAALRALGKFSQYQATDALVYVMQTERDVALHDLAYASLQAATGKDLPPDPKAWEDMLHNNKMPPPAPEPNPIRRVVGWFSPSELRP
jgi:HEAT repeat protein